MHIALDAVYPSSLNVVDSFSDIDIELDRLDLGNALERMQHRAFVHDFEVRIMRVELLDQLRIAGSCSKPYPGHQPTGALHA